MASPRPSRVRTWYVHPSADFSWLQEHVWSWHQEDSKWGGCIIYTILKENAPCFLLQIPLNSFHPLLCLFWNMFYSFSVCFLSVYVSVYLLVQLPVLRVSISLSKAQKINQAQWKTRDIKKVHSHVWVHVPITCGWLNCIHGNIEIFHYGKPRFICICLCAAVCWGIHTLLGLIWCNKSQSSSSDKKLIQSIGCLDVCSQNSLWA